MTALRERNFAGDDEALAPWPSEHGVHLIVAGEITARPTQELEGHGKRRRIATSCDEIEAEEGKKLITLIMRIPAPGDDDPLIIPEPLISSLIACNNATVYTDYGNDSVLRDWGLFASLQTEF